MVTLGLREVHSKYYGRIMREELIFHGRRVWCSKLVLWFIRSHCFVFNLLTMYYHAKEYPPQRENIRKHQENCLMHKLSRLIKWNNSPKTFLNTHYIPVVCGWYMDGTNGYTDG